MNVPLSINSHLYNYFKISPIQLPSITVRPKAGCLLPAVQLESTLIYSIELVTLGGLGLVPSFGEAPYCQPRVVRSMARVAMPLFHDPGQASERPLRARDFSVKEVD